MDFKISKPTLIDIPQMRNLIMPEVQKGIILDRTEDEMAGAIRSYSVVRIAESSALNSSLGASCGDFGNLGRFADSSPVSHPKFPKNSTISTANTRICDFKNADSAFPTQKSQKNAEFAGKIIAFSALHILSITLAEVRSLIVAPDFRRKGLATLLINQLLKEARALNLKEVLSLTYQREVFEKLGFKEIAKESLPNQKIWADCIKCKKFPVCDEIALLKTL